MFTTPLTPFSGISLIVHLAIIGSAKIFELFGKKDFKIGGRNRGSPAFLLRIRDAIVAFALFFGIFAIMLVSTFVAINTSVREGANEWHNIYISQQFEYIRENPPRFISEPLTVAAELMAGEATAESMSKAN